MTISVRSLRPSSPASRCSACALLGGTPPVHGRCERERRLRSRRSPRGGAGLAGRRQAARRRGSPDRRREEPLATLRLERFEVFAPDARDRPAHRDRRSPPADSGQRLSPRPDRGRGAVAGRAVRARDGRGPRSGDRRPVAPGCWLGGADGRRSRRPAAGARGRRCPRARRAGWGLPLRARRARARRLPRRRRATRRRTWCRFSRRRRPLPVRRTPRQVPSITRR